MSEYVCVWCGAPAETHHHVTDITTYPRRDYKRHFCYRCEYIENSIYERMERKYGEVHYGTVTSVTFAKNGYPITRVNFPTYGGGITREYAVEMLVAPEDVDAKVKYHKQGLMGRAR